eukprot:PhM_4_TR1414/c0_g1_i1/m.15236
MSRTSKTANGSGHRSDRTTCPASSVVAASERLPVDTVHPCICQLCTCGQHTCRRCYPKPSAVIQYDVPRRVVDHSTYRDHYPQKASNLEATLGGKLNNKGPRRHRMIRAEPGHYATTTTTTFQPQPIPERVLHRGRTNIRLDTDPMLGITTNRSNFVPHPDHAPPKAFPNPLHQKSKLERRALDSDTTNRTLFCPKAVPPLTARQPLKPRSTIRLDSGDADDNVPSNSTYRSLFVTDALSQPQRVRPSSTAAGRAPRRPYRLIPDYRDFRTSAKDVGAVTSNVGDATPCVVPSLPPKPPSRSGHVRYSPDELPPGTHWGRT